MSATHVNVVKTHDYTWEIEVSSDSNKVTSKLKYSDTFVNWQDRCPALGSAHPDFSGMVLKKIKASRIPGNIVEVELAYESWDVSASYPGRPADTDPITLYDVEIGEGEEPLLAHKRYAELSTAERTALSEILNGNIYKDEATKELWEKAITSERGLEALSKIRKTITSTKVSGLIYIEKKTITSLADIEYAKVNTIQEPPAGADTPSGYNWLYITPRVTANADGASWQIEKRWQLSGSGGWDAQLYAAPS